MGQVLHGRATTTAAVRRAIQDSQESLRALTNRYGINPKTVAKWKKRTSLDDLPTGERVVKSTVLTVEEEAVIIAFRHYALLALDDCLYEIAGDYPEPDALLTAPLPATSWHLPYKIHTVLTDNGIQFSFPPRYAATPAREGTDDDL